MNVKDRRIDLRWKMAEKSPVEVDEICKTILQEREKIMYQKTGFLIDQLNEVLPYGFASIRKFFPDMWQKFDQALNVYNAQALRWVGDESSPVEWDDSDAYRAAAELGYLALEIASLEIYR